MREEAQKRIGHLYPPVEITAEMAKERPDLKPLVGQKLTVIAWLWARTVKSPNPAFSHVDVPLASTFILSSKEGKEAYVQPVVEGDRYRFTVKLGTPPPEAKNGTKASRRGANFRCLVSGRAYRAATTSRPKRKPDGWAHGSWPLLRKEHAAVFILRRQPKWKPSPQRRSRLGSQMWSSCQQALGFRVGELRHDASGATCSRHGSWWR